MEIRRLYCFGVISRRECLLCALFCSLRVCLAGIITSMRSDRRRAVVRRAVVALGLLLPTSLDQVSEAFILSAPASCVRIEPGEAVVWRSCRRTPYVDPAERRRASGGFYGKRYRGQVSTGILDI